MKTDGPGWREVFASPLNCLAFGFGTGLFPAAPGTAASLAALPLVWLMSLLPAPAAGGLVLLFALAGVRACGAASRALPGHDHPAIVWDEIVGMMIAMLFIPFTWSTLVAAFVLFRLFDIWKPWPIRLLDRRVGGGLGVMLDDIAAGVLANVVLRLLPGL